MGMSASYREKLSAAFANAFDEVKVMKLRAKRGTG
jgi:hypothetical protein